MSADACDGCPYVLACWAGQFKTGTTTREDVTVMHTACAHTMLYAWHDQQWIVLCGECPRPADIGFMGTHGCPRCDAQHWREALLKGRGLRFIAEEG